MLNVRVMTMGCLPVETWKLMELNGKGGVGNRGRVCEKRSFFTRLEEGLGT